MAIALTSAGTVAISITKGQPLDLMIAAPFVGGALAGMLLGRLTASRLAGPKLQTGFACLMLMIAAGMFWQALA